MANHMRFGNEELIQEDKEWIDGLSKSKKQKITNNKDIVKNFDLFGYKF